MHKFLLVLEVGLLGCLLLTVVSYCQEASGGACRMEERLRIEGLNIWEMENTEGEARSQSGVKWR